ncbi:2'-5' RNA ligase family protein [Deltaproteobacteria bacterium]|nr:2'-5' RNA ligase family protein [Deltaproteobacteria bacterium]
MAKAHTSSGVVCTKTPETPVLKVASTHLLTMQHQARVVTARMKLAGWWSIDPTSGTGDMIPPPVDKGGLLNAIPGTDPDEKHYLGDGPLDVRIEFIEKIDEMYRSTWGRPVTLPELRAVLQVPVWAEEGHKLYGSWPMNQWIDVAAKHMDVRQSVVLSLPEDSLNDARRLWRAHRNSGIQIGVPMPRGGFERTDETLQDFLDHIQASFSIAQRSAVVLVDAVDPDRLRLASLYQADKIPGGVGDKAKPGDVNPKQLAKGISVEMEHTDDKALAREIALDHLSEPGNADYYDRLETIEKHSMDKKAEMTHAASIALMKWLSVLTKRLGVAQHVYVVGGAVRNFLIDQPIKDIDMVVDSIAMGRGRDSEWVANQVARQIPAKSDIVVDNLMVSKVQIRGSWVLDGHEMEGNDIEIVNARLEEYETNAQGEYVGHKPINVEPTDMETDVTRREFTFNTLMWRLIDLADGPDKAEIIDLTGCGLRDLENREMRCPGDADDIFAKDPTRIIRIIKFAHKYGFKLPSDTKAAAMRQAKGLKRIPAKVWGALHDIVLESSQYKKALVVMDDLGVIDVLKEMVQEDRQFRTTLSGYTNKRGVAFMFDLMDLGLPVGGSIKFLNNNEQRRFREITTGMDRDEALYFLAAIKKPGNAVNDGTFQPGLESKYGITKREKGTFFPMVAQVSRDLLLDDPLLVGNTTKLKRLIADRVETQMAKLRRASSRRASLNESWGLTMGTTDTEFVPSMSKCAGVTGKGESVGMFIPLPKELADQFPSLGADDDSPTHVTLFYGGGVPKERQEEYINTIKGVLSGFGPIKARLGDVDYFTHVEKQRRVAYVRVWFSRDMGSLRDRLRSAIEDAGFESKDSFPLAYNPHVTLAYMDGLDSEYSGPVPEGDWQFDSIPLWGLPQKHDISLRGGSSLRVANTHLGLLPVMDPLFNVRECVKQLILLEDHLFHPRKRCPDCIKKHTLFAEALMEEAVTLDRRGEHPYLSKLAEDIRSMGRAILTMPLEEAAQVARQIRKLMVSQLLGIRALDIERNG